MTTRVLKVSFVVILLGIFAAVVTLKSEAGRPDPWAGLQRLVSDGKTSDKLSTTQIAELTAASERRGANGARLFAPDLQQTRQLTPVAGHSFSVFATKDGHLCLYIEQLAQTCGNGVDPSRHYSLLVVDPDVIGSGEPLVIAGLVDDDVVRLNVLINGQPVTVAPVRNAFALKASSPSITPADVGGVTVSLGEQ